jgi:AcrR family transcriptional regulator
MSKFAPSRQIAKDLALSEPISPRRRGAKSRNGAGRTATNEPSTKTLLIDAGERLIAYHGFDGMVLRDVAELAGQANSSVVQYHFSDKAGLIHAILEDRSRRREILRAKHLNKLKATGRQNRPRDLVAALWLPLLAFKDDDGKHVFCHFALQCLLQGDLPARRLIQEFLETQHKADAKAGASALHEVLDLLQDACEHLSARALHQRLAALNLMFVASVVEFDNAPLNRSNRKFDPDLILEMAVAVLADAQPNQKR